MILWRNFMFGRLLSWIKILSVVFSHSPACCVFSESFYPSSSS